MDQYAGHLGEIKCLSAICFTQMVTIPVLRAKKRENLKILWSTKLKNLLNLENKIFSQLLGLDF